ncbi:MAG TPA: hypothetical protein VFF68_10815 [Anaerolineaceae bacterium]|nr:hypothetical protein [Anaerolineaceae bacterium]
MQEFSSLAEHSFFSFGGYTCVKPRAWKHYLDGVLRERYPGVQLQNDAQKIENNCVFESLESYLFSAYGVFIPRQNLFSVYNRAGEGISPDRMVEVITALIEPLGFEIDSILVADPDLRLALGGLPLFVGLERVADFNGQPGICVINIENGYSHAFFWNRMNGQKFTSDRFRMAIRVRRKGRQPELLSAVAGLETYGKMLKEGAAARLAPSENGESWTQRVDSLLDYVHKAADRQSSDFRQVVDERLGELIVDYRLSADSGWSDEDGFITDVGEMVRRIFRQAPEIR